MRERRRERERKREREREVGDNMSTTRRKMHCRHSTHKTLMWNCQVTLVTVLGHPTLWEA